MIYDKCMRTASWSSDGDIDEESPLLNNPEEEANTQSGLLINLISQDTYNVMSCVSIFHYNWAIPLKVKRFCHKIGIYLHFSTVLST